MLICCVCRAAPPFYMPLFLAVLIAASTSSSTFSGNAFAQDPFARRPTAPAQNATDKGLKSDIDLLLNKYWDKNTANRTAAAALARSSKFAEHESFQLALSLNRMHHNRMKEARDVATNISKNSPTNLEGWMQTIWLETLTDNYDRALVDMKKFRKQLDATKNLDPTLQQRAYRRMGKLIGYMQGPVSEDINGDTLQTVLTDITAGLAPETLKEFNQQREAVLKKYEELTTKNTEFIKNESDKVAAENSIEKARLTNENESIEKRINSLSPQLDKLKQDFDRQIGTLEQQASPLESRLASLATTIDSASYNLRTSISDFYYLQNNFPNSPLLFGMQNRIRNQQFDLNRLENDANGVSNQLQALSIQHGRIQSTYNARVEQLNRDVERLDKTKRKNLRRLTKVSGAPKVASGKVVSRAQQAAALSTYDPFPFELYREQLIEQLLDK